MSEAANDSPTTPVDRLLELAQDAAWDELELAWTAALEEGNVPLGGFVAALRQAAEDGDEAAPLESLAWYLLSEWSEAHGAAASLAAVREVADLLPDGGLLREQVAAIYREACADAPGIETLLAMTLLPADVPLAAGVARLERLLAMTPGTFVRDPRRKSPGRVIGVNAERKGLSVSFGESGRTYDAAGVDGLEVLDADDYRALAVFEPDRLGAMAAADPVELVRLALKAHGPRLDLKALKERLAPAVAARSWSAWWKNARPQVKRSAAIEMTDSKPVELILRSRLLGYEQQVRRDFAAADGDAARLRLALEHLAHPAEDAEVESAILAFLGEGLAAMAGGAGLRSASGLGAAALLAEIRRRAPEAAGEAPPAESLPGPRELPAILGDVADEALAGSILAFVRQAMPETWAEAYARTLPAASPATSDRMAVALTEGGQGEALARAVGEVLERPVVSAGALVWLWKAAGGAKGSVALDADQRYASAIGILKAADATKRLADPGAGPQPGFLGEIRSVLTAKGYRTFRAVLAECDEGQARAIRVLAERNDGLTDAQRSRVLDLIRAAHPAMYAEAPLPPWEEDVVYTTAEGMHRTQEELDVLIHVKMRENSEAIGKAVAMGDLSENSEYTAALEQRERLTERANALQEDLAKARIIPPHLAESGTVNVGTAVLARDLDSGSEERLVFLGPWDSDVEKSIYYYRTALGLAFMGKAPGDRADLDTGARQRSWEILSVEPAV